MTVVARRIIATPVRSASETWATIVNILAPQSDSEAHKELLAIEGIACSLITDETLKNSAAVVYGSGPRVRIYCLYNDDACSAEDANEAPLTFDATSGDWQMSLPCHADDLSWVKEALKKRAIHITARDMTAQVEAEEAVTDSVAKNVTVDKEAFFRI